MSEAEGGYQVRPLRSLAEYDAFEGQLAVLLGGDGPPVDITKPGVGLPRHIPKEWVVLVRAMAEERQVRQAGK